MLAKSVPGPQIHSTGAYSEKLQLLVFVIDLLGFFAWEGMTDDVGSGGSEWSSIRPHKHNKWKAQPNAWAGSLTRGPTPPIFNSFLGNLHTDMHTFPSNELTRIGRPSEALPQPHACIIWDMKIDENSYTWTQILNECGYLPRLMKFC